MKRFLLSLAVMACAITGAFAADLPAAIRNGYQAAPVAIYNWQGVYVGIHGGYAAGSATVHDTNGGVAPGPFGYHPNAAFGGGQIGYNWQFGNIVVGPEVDVGYFGTSGKGVIGSANAAAHQDLTLGSGFYADVTARAGYAVDNWLVYAKGGYAYLDTSAKQQTTNPGYAATGTGAFNGWTVGGGVEYGITRNITAKVEYLHYDVGSKDGYQTNVSDLSSPLGYRFLNTTSLKFDTVKAGLNYRF